MNIYIYIAYLFVVLFSCFVFWVLLQLALASWGSEKASPKWVTVANSPIMQLISIKWVSTVLSVIMAVNLASLLFMVSISIYTGELITLNR